MPAPLRSDVQPVENETRDRIITGLVTVVPFLALGLAAWQVWGSALHWSDVSLFLGMYLFTGLGITVGFHRCLTHRSFKTHDWLRGRWPSSARRRSRAPSSLVADHRKHSLGRRRRPPQSARRPRRRLAWRSGRPPPRPHRLDLHPHRAGQQDTLRAGPVEGSDGELGGSQLRGVGDRWPAVAFLPRLGDGGTLFAALTGLLWGGLVRVFVLHHFTYSINSLCHVFGSREFETPISPQLLMDSAAFHNSHHAFPTSATHGLPWWQVDISGLIIDGLKRCAWSGTWSASHPSGWCRKTAGGAPSLRGPQW